MQPFIYYVLKTAVCSLILFIYYRVMLRNKAFHAYNRFYLLATILLSLSLPLLQITISQHAELPKANVITMLQLADAGDQYIEKAAFHPSTAHRPATLQNLPGVIYLSFCLVFFMLFIQTLFKIRQLVRKNSCITIDNIHLINTHHEKGTPFSFFRYIFWNDLIDINSDTGKNIFKHELAHVREKHSLDKILINGMLTVFWINPVFWLIRRELNMIHEFIADKYAVKNGDSAAFAAMIISTAYPQQPFLLTNPFFYSPVKRRLMMLTKNQNPKINYISRLMVLPMLLFVFAAFSLRTKIIKPISSTGENQIVVVLDAGHGGNDKGGINENGVAEKDITLSLVKKIRALDVNNNIKLILTRETDAYIDLKAKAAFVESQHPDLFISVHVDDAVKKDWDNYSGMNVYISKDSFSNSEKSRLLASAIIHSFKGNYGISVPELPRQRIKSIYSLEANSCPSVIIEAGYINNKIDFAYLESEKGQETFAQNVLKAIGDFAASAKSVSSSVPPTILPGDTLGYYKGRAVIALSATPGNSAAMITYADNTTEMITLKQAREAHLLPPLPAASSPSSVPPPPPYMVFDAFQSVLINSKNTEKQTIAKGGNLIAVPPFIVIDQKISSKTVLDKISPEEISEINILKKERAVEKYGQAASQGAIEVKTRSFIKLNPERDPVFSIGDLTKPRLPADEFKKQTVMKVSDGYDFSSATVFFSGANFPNVATAVISGSSLSNIKVLMDRCLPGSAITFDNVKVTGPRGMMTIEERSFILY